MPRGQQELNIIVLLLIFTLFSVGLEHFIRALRGPQENMRKHIIWAQICWGMLVGLIWISK